MPTTRGALLLGAEVPLSSVSGTTTVNKILVPTPDKGHIVITAFQLQNESSAATTIILRNGTREIWRVLGQNQGDGCGYNFGSGLHLNEGLDLNMTVSGANSCGYNIAYYIEI